MMKTRALKGPSTVASFRGSGSISLHSARAVTSDVRNYAAHKIMAMGVRSIMHHLYPRLLALHDLDDIIALPRPDTGESEMPSLMRDSHLFMEGHGVYLMGELLDSLHSNCFSPSTPDNEESMMLWVGQSVSPQLLQDLFAVDDQVNIDRNMVRLPPRDICKS